MLFELHKPAGTVSMQDGSFILQRGIWRSVWCLLTSKIYLPAEFYQHGKFVLIKTVSQRGHQLCVFNG
ncbi:hypothetical protein VI06_18270 [Aquitalea magnusonii]|nr:hypothetical protein VI06_18270 [Aquitalea magnusonii]